MTMPLTLALMLWATRNLQALPRVLVVAAPITVQMTALLFTLSRGPWIGIAFGMTAMAIVLGLTAGRRLVAILGAVVAIAIVVGYLATLIPSHNSSSESVDGRITDRVGSIYSDAVGGNLSTRFDIWDTSFRVLADRPWVDGEYPELPSLSVRALRPLVGYGPDMFLYTLPLTGEPQLTGARHYHAHNFLINAAVELGAIGFVTTAALIGALAAAGLALFRRARQREFPPFVTLGLAGLLGALSGRFVEQMGGVPQISDLTVFWLLAGVIVAVPSLVKHRVPVASGGAGDAGGRSGATSRTRIAIAVVLAVGLGAFLWAANVRYVQASVIAASAGVAFKDGEFESSIRRLDKAIDLAPDVMAYRLNKAIALTAQGAEMEELEEARPVHRRGPTPGLPGDRAQSDGPSPLGPGRRLHPRAGLYRRRQRPRRHPDPRDRRGATPGLLEDPQRRRWRVPEVRRSRRCDRAAGQVGGHHGHRHGVRPGAVPAGVGPGADRGGRRTPSPPSWPRFNWRPTAAMRGKPTGCSPTSTWMRGTGKRPWRVGRCTAFTGQPSSPRWRISTRPFRPSSSRSSLTRTIRRRRRERSCSRALKDKQASGAAERDAQAQPTKAGY